jgi:hypothetical protein
MKRITRIVAAAALAVSFAVLGLGGTVEAQEMEHGRRPPSSSLLRAY